VKRIFLLTYTFFLFFQVVFAQDDRSLKLSVAQARDYALRNNRTVHASRIDIDIANQKIRENLGTGLPQFNINANYLHQFTVPEISFGPIFDPGVLPSGPVTGEDIRNAFSESPKIPLGIKNNTVIDFTVSQLVFNGQYFIGLKTAKVVRQMSEKSLEKTEDQVKMDVDVSYYTILVLKENIRLLGETGKALSQMYEETSGMNKQGLNEETDVDQVNINLSNVQALITSMESQIEIANKQLKYLLGVDFEQQMELTDSLNGIIGEGNLKYLSENEFNIQNSLDFQIINIQENVNEKLLKLEKSKYLPTLSAFYRHEEQTNQPQFNFAVKDVVGASLSLPFFSGGSRSSRVKQAKYDLEKTRLNKQDTEMGLTMEYETARNNYQTAWNTFNINRESMDLSKKIYDRTVIKFHEGVSSSFELTQIQNQFLTAESNYYNSMLSLLRSKAELDRILRINN
jgi:outer membrane protein TolC